MRSLSLLGLFICLFAVGCATDPYKVTKPYLYEITTKENNKKGYLFGDLELALIVEDLPSDFWPYFDQSDIVVTEISDDQYIKRNSQFVEHMWKDKSDRKIQEILTPAEFARVQSIVNIDIPRDDRQKFYEEVSLFGLFRFLVGSNIQRVSVTRGEFLRSQPDNNLEQNMLKRASSKKIDSLDETDGELLMCQIQDDKVNLQRVKLALKMLDQKTTIDQFRLMATAYRKGDSAGFLVASNEGMIAPDDCVSRIQHQAWARKMVSFLKTSEQPFFIVNVERIIQPTQSLVEYLNKQGYSVRRVNEIDLPEKK